MIERRTIVLDEARIERRAQGATIAGIGLPFESPALVNGLFLESWAGDSLDAQARDGWTFDDGGPNRSVLSLWNHDPGRVLGSVVGGTLRLSVTSAALRYQLNLPESAADVAEAVMRGDVNGASVAFTNAVDVWGAAPDGTITRRIQSATLLEVSLCAWPVYAGTTADVSGPITGRSRTQRVAQRVGKMLSAVNLDRVEGAHRILRDLLDAALVGKPADSDVLDGIARQPFEQAIEQLRDLLDAAKSEAPADSEVFDRSLRVIRPTVTSTPTRRMTFREAEDALYRRACREDRERRHRELLRDVDLMLSLPRR